MDKEKIIEMVKALGLTAEELGFEEKIKRDEEFDELVKRFINALNLKDKARDYFSEKYHELLGIQEKYKILEVRMARTIYKDIRVAIPQDEDDLNMWDYLPDLNYELSNDYPDDEDDWSDERYNTFEENLTADQVRYECCEEDLINYSDFDSH